MSIVRAPGFVASFRPAVKFGLMAAGCLLGAASMGCSTHHWAPVEASHLPPPAGEKVLHTDRLVVEISEGTDETQCVVYEKHHPICFFNLKPALEQGLARSLWPSFPEVVIDKAGHASPSDYVLQVEVTLDALPPDDAGPGWSAGARSRFRLMRDGKVIAEETLASRSRAHFPYGAPLGEGATEVVDATILHVAQAVSAVPETRPDAAQPLPRVASRTIKQESKPAPSSPSDAAPATATPSAQAKTDAAAK